MIYGHLCYRPKTRGVYIKASLLLLWCLPTDKGDRPFGPRQLVVHLLSRVLALAGGEGVRERESVGEGRLLLLCVVLVFCSVDSLSLFRMIRCVFGVVSVSVVAGRPGRH